MCQQDTFSEQLPDQALPACSEREARGDLPFSPLQTKGTNPRELTLSIATVW